MHDTEPSFSAVRQGFHQLIPVSACSVMEAFLAGKYTGLRRLQAA
jgi:hypothetical protein